MIRTGFQDNEVVINSPQVVAFIQLITC